MKAWIVASLRLGAWAPLLVFGLHAFGSLAFDAYARWPLLDLLMHLAGGIAMAHFVLVAMREAAAHGIGGSPDSLFQRACALLAVGTAAGFWEFAEFGSDRFFGTHAQLGLEDTLLDMALGLAGAGLRVMLARPTD